MSARGARWLLRLLPRALRERHGAEMEALLEEELRAARRRGRVRWARAWLEAAADVAKRAGYERSRAASSVASALGQDLRFAFRGFVRQPGITLLVVVMLALGVGAATAVFTLVNGLFLRPLSFPESDRLVLLNETAPKWELEETGISYADFVAWRADARAFEAMGLIGEEDFNLADGREAERVAGAMVTHDLDDALGIEPLFGRGFTAEEDRPGGAPVVLVGYELWRRRFGGSAAAVGRTLRVDGVPRTVVGVLPPEASFPDRVDLWIPLALDPVEEEGSYSYLGIGRLRPGVTIESARGDLLRAHQAVWAARDTARIVSPTVAPLRERLTGEFRALTMAMAAAVGLVLLIACANVASVLLARSFARRRELGIRRALGAGVGRLARQLFTESIALSLVAAPLGLLLGFWSVHLLLRSLPEEVPLGWLELAPDWRFGVFGLGIVLATSILFGWAPIFQARHEDVRTAIVEGTRAGASRAQRRTMNLLVVSEITLASVLLVGGGLLLRAFDRLRDVDPGFRTEQVLTFRLGLPEQSYPDSAARGAFYRAAKDRLSALPGVRAAGAVTCAPLGCHSGVFFTVEGDAADPGAASPVVLYRHADTDYFEAMGIRRVRGRLYEEYAADGDPEVVVNLEFARHFLRDADPIGRRIRFHGGTGPWFTVVGVVRDARHYGLEEEMRPGVYFPLEPRPQSALTFALWSSLRPESLAGPARAAIRAIDPELPLYQIASTGEMVERSLSVRRTYSTVMAGFAATALVLALGGIYGVLTYLVGQRIREIGIRVALGASRGRVMRLVLRHGLTLTLAGLLLGLGAAAAAGRLLGGLLFGVSPHDPATFAAVGIVLLVTASVAALVPARRALGVDPQVVLREE